MTINKSSQFSLAALYLVSYVYLEMLLWMLLFVIFVKMWNIYYSKTFCLSINISVAKISAGSSSNSIGTEDGYVLEPQGEHRVTIVWLHDVHENSYM